jgi:hypothetical protein
MVQCKIKMTVRCHYFYLAAQYSNQIFGAHEITSVLLVQCKNQDGRDHNRTALYPIYLYQLSKAKQIWGAHESARVVLVQCKIKMARPLQRGGLPLFIDSIQQPSLWGPWRYMCPVGAMQNQDDSCGVITFIRQLNTATKSAGLMKVHVSCWCNAKIKMAATITAWHHIHFTLIWQLNTATKSAGLMKVHVSCWCNAKIKMAATITTWRHIQFTFIYHC